VLLGLGLVVVLGSAAVLAVWYFLPG